MPNYLKEAFKELELLNEETFSFDKDGAAELKKFYDGDTTDDYESIIDPEAETKDELEDSYEGKVIIACKICHGMQYKDPQDIVIDEESDYVNVGEECPACSAVDGYKIVGQVAPYCVECDEEGKDVEIFDGLEEALDSKEIFDRGWNSSLSNVLRSKHIKTDKDTYTILYYFDPHRYRNGEEDIKIQERIIDSKGSVIGMGYPKYIIGGKNVYRATRLAEEAQEKYLSTHDDTIIDKAVRDIVKLAYRPDRSKYTSPQSVIDEYENSNTTSTNESLNENRNTDLAERKILQLKNRISREFGVDVSEPETRCFYVDESPEEQESSCIQFRFPTASYPELILQVTYDPIGKGYDIIDAPIWGEVDNDPDLYTEYEYTVAGVIDRLYKIKDSEGLEESLREAKKGSKELTTNKSLVESSDSNEELTDEEFVSKIRRDISDSLRKSKNGNDVKSFEVVKDTSIHRIKDYYVEVLFKSWASSWSKSNTMNDIAYIVKSNGGSNVTRGRSSYRDGAGILFNRKKATFPIQ